MWSAPVQRQGPDGSNYSLVLLDTEGIDAYDQARKHKLKAFKPLSPAWGSQARGQAAIPSQLLPQPGQRAPRLTCCCVLQLANLLNHAPALPCTALQTGQYSTQIFSLAVLLSSLFVFNQMGGIDEAALDRWAQQAQQGGGANGWAAAAGTAAAGSAPMGCYARYACLSG
jgi:hypothetical protein